MIVGIGTDICAIKRVEDALKKYEARFIKRLLTPTEQAQLSSPSPAQLAKRWAAKEAASKALGTGIGEALSFQDIEITHDAIGKPLLAVNNANFKHLSFHLSLSDETDYALAFVVAERL